MLPNLTFLKRAVLVLIGFELLGPGVTGGAWIGRRNQEDIPSGQAEAEQQPQLQEFLDLKCYRIEQGRPLNQTLALRHLNPVLQGAPDERVVVREPQQLCVPVAKEGQRPPDNLLRFIQYIDLKCYRIEPGSPLQRTLVLRHLNPVLRQRGAPAEEVVVLEPLQLCVPVAKAGINIPPDVVQLVQYIDLKCYRIVQGQSLGQTLRLQHLNPLFQRLPEETVVVQQPQKLCVPVAKEGIIPPPDVLQLIQVIDQKCYDIQRGTPLNQTVTLQHLNPVLRRRLSPSERVTLREPQQLCVPVLKAPAQ